MGRFDTALHAYIIPKYLTVRPFDSIVIEGPLAPFHFSRHTLHSKSRSNCLALGAEAADWADGDGEFISGGEFGGICGGPVKALKKKDSFGGCPHWSQTVYPRCTPYMRTKGVHGVCGGIA